MYTLEDLRQEQVAVVGFGQEGQTVAKYLVTHGIKPVILDVKAFSDLSTEARETISDLQLELRSGPDYLSSAKDFSVLFRSPGVWRLNPLLIKAEQNDTYVSSLTQWMFDNLQCKTIGITGTKGKTTTASLLYQILQTHLRQHASESRVYLTGNIGTSDPLIILDQARPTDIVVYELSSFQLQDLKRAPDIAVVLMTTIDHLDHHKTSDEYWDAKRNIVSKQSQNQLVVINIDYEGSRSIADGLSAKNLFTISKKVKTKQGIYISESGILHYTGLPGRTIGHISASNTVLRGAHNLENFAAAALVALLLGADPDSIESVIKNFTGVKHRLELVANHSGIKFYDDSIATVPESSIAALQSFTEPTIAILGGSLKGSDYTDLGMFIARSNTIKAIILLGEAGKLIQKAIEQVGGFSGTIIENCKTMEEIFQTIKTLAVPGDVVVLSPAAASFGLFKSYQDRGNQFRLHAIAWKST